jgi:hypothetical protein
MIKKKGKKFVAASSTGKELSKKEQTKEEAIKQLRAVEISKKKRGKK